MATSSSKLFTTGYSYTVQLNSRHAADFGPCECDKHLYILSFFFSLAFCQFLVYIMTLCVTFFFSPLFVCLNWWHSGDWRNKVYIIISA